MENPAYPLSMEPGSPAGSEMQMAVPGIPRRPRIDVPKFRSIYDDLTPGLRYLKDHVADYFNSRLGRDWAFSPENLGRKTDELEQVRKDEHAAAFAVKAAEQTAGMDDAEFDRVRDQIIAEAMGGGTPYQEPGLQNPNWMQGLASAAGAALFPKHAFEIGAAPFNFQLDERDRNKAIALEAYERGERERGRKAGLLTGTLREVNERDSKRADLENDALDRESRERIAAATLASREDTEIVKAAKKALNDPKSTKVARAAALNDLANAGTVYPPNMQQEFLNSTYYEDNLVAEQNRKAKETEGRISLWAQREAESKVRTDKLIPAQAGLATERRNLIQKQVAHFEERFEADMAKMYGELAIKEGLLGVAIYDSETARSRLAQSDVESLRGILETGVNSAQDAIANTEITYRQLQKLADDYRFNGKPVPAEIASEYNRQAQMLYGADRDGDGVPDGGGMYDQFRELSSKLSVLGPSGAGAKGAGPQPERVSRGPQSGGSRGTLKQDANGVWQWVPNRGSSGGGRSGRRSENQALGQSLAAESGWSGKEWDALKELWTRESGWNENAQNAKSTAYGIAQFLDGTWERYGFKKSGDAANQIKAGLAYIKKRYGSPSKALKFHDEKGWY